MNFIQAYNNDSDRKRKSGILFEAQESLFTEFTRLDGKNMKGHGLGFSIVKRIIEKLKGQVGVESEVGRGSTFYFTCRCINF